jgi:hypothetical protein
MKYADLPESQKQSIRLAVKKWQKKNPEKVKALRAKYYARDRFLKSKEAKSWRSRNPDYNIKRYGLTQLDFETMAGQQKGLCLICQKAPKKLCVDHCHSTNSIRGLLCLKCNSALGLFSESFSTIIRAADYIRRNTFVQN